MKLRARSAAKINLTLDITARRDDGYHELESVVHTVGLWDELQFDFARSLSLRCNISALETSDNLCLRAARLWLERARQNGLAREHEVAISLHKTIPSGSGLGGGSGNAAATLLALNHLYRVQLPDRTLQHIALSLGADVPFFLRGGCALMEGIGERLRPLPALRGWLLIVQPAATLGTPQVYAAWDALPKADAPAPSASLSGSPSATMQGILEASVPGNTASGAQGKSFPAVLLANVLHNDLSFAAQECGVAVTAIIEALKGCGAAGASMTGSGSAVFGIFDSEAAAQQALLRLRESHGALCDVAYAAVAPFCEPGIEFAPFASETAPLMARSALHLGSSSGGAFEETS